MGIEIERKYLVKNDSWRENIQRSYEILQSYFDLKNAVFRARIVGDSKAFLTIKILGSGISRKEFEYEIPVPDARELVSALCSLPPIEKVRHEINFAGKKWEVDEFKGLNKGLIMAEIELECEDEKFEKPEWIGEEVTGNPQYSNSFLYRKPFSKW